MVNRLMKLPEIYFPKNDPTTDDDLKEMQKSMHELSDWLSATQFNNRINYLELSIKADQFKNEMKKADRFMECLGGLEDKLQDQINIIKGTINGLSDCIHEKHIRIKLFGNDIEMLKQQMINLEDKIAASDFLDRLKKLEDSYLVNFEEAKGIIFAGAQTHASILRCEAKLKEHEEIIKRITNDDMKMGKKPHKCPICDGQGGFYMNGTMDSKCNACKETGIVWG